MCDVCVCVCVCVCACVCKREGERESLECVLCCLDDASNVSSLSLRICCILCQVPHAVITSVKYVHVCERQREREKVLSGSCAVWIISAACQDVALYVRNPMQ